MNVFRQALSALGGNKASRIHAFFISAAAPHARPCSSSAVRAIDDVTPATS
jgi:hypothetical protein